MNSDSIAFCGTLQQLLENVETGRDDPPTAVLAFLFVLSQKSNLGSPL